MRLISERQRSAFPVLSASASSSIKDGPPSEIESTACFTGPTTTNPDSLPRLATALKSRGIKLEEKRTLHKRKEIRISGFGGQGVVLSGEIVGKAASIYDKGFATLTQSYGPEARGGSCTAEVVISDEPIDYPYVMLPKVTIILSQEAYNNFGQDPNWETLIIIDPDLVNADLSNKPTPLSIPANRMAREMGRVVV